MSDKNPKVITINDFNVICRICLQIEENMIDIYESGLENQLMEVTHLKLKNNDELPRTLCQKCIQQVNQFIVFLEQAKSSDHYLRSLLAKSEASCTDEEVKATEEKKMKRKKSCKRTLNKQKKDCKNLNNDENEPESDPMYLIYVPESNDINEKADREICIKNLCSESDNLGLTNYCRTLVNCFSDHTYPKEQRCFYKENNCDSIDHHSNSSLDLNSDKSKIYPVNLLVYMCSECYKSFEEMSDLTEHFSTHEVEPTSISSYFYCPVCAFSVKEKTIFLIHLQGHKEEGFLFVKINADGEVIPPKDNETDLFIKSVSKHTNYCNIFCVNLISFQCALCYENMESKDAILEHLEFCLSKEKSQIKFRLKYLCPMCGSSFGDEDIFIQHLSSHKEENCYFIRVNDAGEPVEVEENDEFFVPFEEAVTFLLKKNSVFQVIDQNMCHKCNHRSDNFDELFQHYNAVHLEKFSFKISFSCPACPQVYGGDDAYDEQAKFHQHLRKHKNDGMVFILVKENGEMVELNIKKSDLFTQSMFLWSAINKPALLFQNCSPKLVVLEVDDASTLSYTADVIEEQLRIKQESTAEHEFHESKDLTENVNYICEKCGKKCSGKENYKKHFSKHSRNFSKIYKKPVCAICNKTFANRSTLSSHMKQHLREGKEEEFCLFVSGKICDKCGQNFSSNSSLTRHKLKHSREKQTALMKCEICGREFLKQSLFDKHKSAHLNPKYFECHICKLPLPSVGTLKKHSEIHKNGSLTFDCQDCKLSFLTKDSLIAHESHTGHYQSRKPLECNVCHEKFFISRKFMEHIKTHPKYKMGQCTLCGKRLSTIQSLMLHMRRHFESNRILCPHCGKQFFEEKNYHRHLLTHKGIKPYPCDIEGCKKSFYTFFELNRHKKYHNNTRDFSCPYCSKSFHEANHLTVHIRTHTGERPYTCPHCNKGFVTRTHCKQHIKLVHQGIGYDLIKTNISKKVTVFQAIETTVKTENLL